MTKELTKLFKIFLKSKNMKERAGWSRDIGAGFLTEDIAGVYLERDWRASIKCPTCKKQWKRERTCQVQIILKDGTQMVVPPTQLNLRETDAVFKFLKTKIKGGD